MSESDFPRQAEEEHSAEDLARAETDFTVRPKTLSNKGSIVDLSRISLLRTFGSNPGALAKAMALASGGPDNDDSEPPASA